MAKYFFFDPAMTNMDTVVFCPDEKAVCLASNISESWVITNDTTIAGIADIIYEFHKRYPGGYITDHHVYAEKEFFDIWGDDGEE